MCLYNGLCKFIMEVKTVKTRKSTEWCKNWPKSATFLEPNGVVHNCQASGTGTGPGPGIGDWGLGWGW